MLRACSASSVGAMARCCMSFSLLCRFKSQQWDAQRRNHGLLVGADYAHRNRGSCAGGNTLRMTAVGVVVDPDPEKIQTFADAFAHGRRVLADSAGEYQRIHAAERRGEGTDPFLCLVAKQLERLRRTRIVRFARQEVPDVRAGFGNAEQS